MELIVLDKNGKETGRKVMLSDEVFGIEPNTHAIYLDVKAHLANKRQGTHKAKTRGQISGSTRKIKKQKGTGTARAGSIKNPLFKGGGRIFGPEPRDYTQKVNKKIKRLARRSALSLKAQNKAIMVVENFDIASPKTKDFVQILRSLNMEDKKSLIVLGEIDKNVYLSSRNLKRSNVVTSSNLNTYMIMNAQNLVLSEGALTDVEFIARNN